MVFNVPSASILSICVIFRMAFRMVAKLVSMPPDQRSVTYGMLTDSAASVTMSLACFFVATNKMRLPLLAICFAAAAASSTRTTVLCKSMM